uniref:Uncharacterized protein n=1 Tax=Oryza punctata TaxID=4537 RepID=A0A0E0JQT8_ORYPU
MSLAKTFALDGLCTLATGGHHGQPDGGQAAMRRPNVLGFGIVGGAPNSTHPGPATKETPSSRKVKMQEPMELKDEVSCATPFPQCGYNDAHSTAEISSDPTLDVYMTPKKTMSVPFYTSPPQRRAHHHHRIRWCRTQPQPPNSGGERRKEAERWGGREPVSAHRQKVTMKELGGRESDDGEGARRWG